MKQTKIIRIAGVVVVGLAVVVIATAPRRAVLPAPQSRPPTIAAMPSAQAPTDESSVSVVTVSRHQKAPLEPDVVAELSAVILQAWNSAVEEDRENVRTNLLVALVELSPATAANLAAALEPDSGRDEMLCRVLQLWTNKDSAAALAWAEQQPEERDRKQRLSTIATQIAQSNPREAVAIAERHQLDSAGGGVMENLAAAWAEQDLNAALAWGGTRPDGDQRNQVLARIAYIEARTVPAEAASRIARELPAGPAQQEAAVSVLHQWALRDFNAAAAWVDRFPEGPLRDRAVSELEGLEAYRQATESAVATGRDTAE